MFGCHVFKLLNNLLKCSLISVTLIFNNLFGSSIFHWQQYSNRLEQPQEKISGRQLQRMLQYTLAPCRPLPTFRRADCAIHQTDCDEVYPNLYVGDA